MSALISEHRSSSHATQSNRIDFCELAEGALHRRLSNVSRGIRCEAEGDTLTLRGEVRTFYHKQLAQESVRLVIGKKRIVNRVRVLQHS